MKLVSTYREIVGIVPQESRPKLRRLFYACLAFSFLDLISIAYMIPAILLLLDQRRFSEFMPSQFHVLPQSTVVVAGIGLLVLFYLVKNILQTRFNNRLYQFLYHLSHTLSMDILERYLTDDYLSFQQSNKGDMIRNITTLTRDFSVSLVGSLLLLSSEALTFSILVSILLFFYFKLAIVAIAAIWIFGFCIYRIKRKEMRLINETYKDAAAKSNAELINILDGYIEIRSSGNYKPFLDKFGKYNRALNRVTAMLTASTGNYSKHLELFMIAGISGLLLFNIFFSTGDNLVLISVLGALSIKLLPSLSKILNAATMVNSHFYSISMLNGMAPIKKRSKVYSGFQSTFELRDINFEYLTGMPVFKNLDFKINKGEIVGIKGVTGAGKTTFLHIASGLLRPRSGSVWIDGIQTDAFHFFPFVSYVPQHPFLFNGSLLENILIGEDAAKADHSYLDFLAENLDLKVLFKSLENGLQTIITHNTSKLSGGQKQRIALLRALYHRPELLILDEATNQQNEALEEKIYTFIRQIAFEDNRAVITVSHNSAIHSYCDRMYVLEKNILIESSGTR